MSRSLGLREDQRVGARLATLIGGLFAVDPLWGICERESKAGATVRRLDLLPKRPAQAKKCQTLGIVATIEGR
ncbi:hypothetical protein QIW53_21170 [Pseudomonas fluorescens]|jgi:hypothetical protein|uniref:hypothetical protein n=1 Tax=Pseudomonas TaxID=286 RepID=UPI00177ADB90|nr:hypothetical protein [Pseudomonas sp. PDM04]MBD9441407.1 hypothetical protein [Pseudomonas sp. PDM04]